ncbi:MAG: hypothetical protein DHS20C14_03450 [Phycisphaeraceae bacterium]|nr:MAG: hypothetical protein DHS20C14_03450 [Phycisphaeraceae bacterium]
MDWVTVEDPGNVAYDRPDTNPLFSGPRGSVVYKYRISKTELTNTQWAEFVQAFSPYWEGSPSSFDLTGVGVVTPDNGTTYVAARGVEYAPADVTWQLAAMYANWMHNGKSGERAAFESGAYDTSDWVWDHSNPNSITGTFERQDGARFWIPNEDEWIKAVYYDPNRYGEGQGGYWQWPTASDNPTPADQTSASMSDLARFLPVGSFPDAVSPWGLLDVSGGLPEWLENSLQGSHTVFLVDGSGTGLGWPDAEDWIDWRPQTFRPTTGSIGLRLAARVPTPSVVLPFLFVFAWRRRW